MKLLLAKTAELLKRDPAPYILGGDFNAEPDSGVMQLCKNCKDPILTDTTAHIPYTFHNFGTRHENKIDYLFVTDELKGAVTSVSCWEEQEDGIYLSDHYPVCMTLSLDALH